MNPFLSRLTGAPDTSYDEYFDDERANAEHDPRPITHAASSAEPAGELAVDVYQTPDAIVVKALIAGVQPSSVDIALTREMLTISGSREEDHEASGDNYYHRELFWGTFSRSIILPEEVDVDHAEASEKHGILIIRLPKINKSRETKLKVRSR